MPFDFTANRTVESIDKVPADFRSFYTEESDGTYALGADGAVADAVKVISGLYKTVTGTRKEADELRGKAIDLSALSAYGEDPDGIAAGIQEALDVATKKGGRKPDADQEAAIAKLRRDLTDVHTAEKTKWGDVQTGLVGQIRGLLVDNKIVQALGDKAVSPTVARKVLADFIDIEQDEAGNFRTIVKGEDGPRKNVTDGQLFTVENLVEELAGHDDYKTLFKSEAPNGSDSRPGTFKRKVGVPVKKAEMSPMDKISAGLAARG